DRLAGADLGELAVDHHRVAAKLGDARREGRLGPQGRLGGDPRDGARTLQRAHRERMLLHLRGQGEHVGLLGGREVVVAEEVPQGGGGHGLPPPQALSRMPDQAAASASTSASVSTSGGTNRIRSGPVALRMKPASWPATTASAATSAATVSPTIRPAPPTSVTRSSAASAPRSRSPVVTLRSSSPSPSTVSRTARAAAAASGLPPKVVPWLPGSKSLPAPPVAMQAPIGTPPARPLARVTMSGTTSPA